MKIQVGGPITRVSDSAGPGWAQEPNKLLISSQMVLILPFQDHNLRTAGLDVSSLKSAWPIP